MKEWILENTTVTEERYDELINSDEKGQEMSKNIKKLILMAIDKYTLNAPTPENMEQWGIETSGNAYIFEGIKFQLFSRVLQDHKLYSKERYHQCHLASFYLAQVLELSVVTAKCIGYSDNSFLHSFVLDEQRGLVYDYCLNVIMSKSNYYDLFDVNEIVKIEYADLIDYYKILEKTSMANENIDYKEVVTFPTEIKEALLRLERTKKQ